MTVTTIFADTNDGDIESFSDAAYIQALEGGGTLSVFDTQTEMWVGQYGDEGDNEWVVWQAFLDFDTSSIPTGHIITAVDLELWLLGDSSDTDFTTLVADHQWTPPLATGDYVRYDQLPTGSDIVASIDSDGIGSTGAYKTLDSEASFRTATNLGTGNVRLLVFSEESYDDDPKPDGLERLEWGTADQTGTTQDPRLVIEHQPPLLDHQPEGGIVWNGATQLHTAKAHEPEGGIVWNGATQLHTAKAHQPEGGIVWNGATQLHTAKAHEPEGGIVWNGTAQHPEFDNGAQVPAGLVLEWDFDNDGNFDDPLEDITSWVLEGECVAGRDFPSLLNGKSGAGRLQALLDDTDGRFGFFNQASPLNQEGRSLRVGRKLRLRTTEAPNPDPQLLVRDRFNRADSEDMDDAETGQPWTQHTVTSNADFEIVDQLLVADPTMFIQGTYRATLTPGLSGDTYYVQATVAAAPQRTSGIDAGETSLIFDWQDSDNYSLVTLEQEDAQLQLWHIVDGNPQAGPTRDVEIYEHQTVGVLRTPTEVTAYLEGIPLLTDTPEHGTGDVGLEVRRRGSRITPHRISRFDVWDGLPQDVAGVLWTGNVETVNPDVVAGPSKVARVTAIGRLSVLAEQDVPEATSIVGRPAGQLVGWVLGQTGLLLPPAGKDLVDEGTVETGTVLGDPSVGRKGIQEARRFEEAEFGFLYETPAGHIAFEQFSARGTSPVAWLSDSPHSQFRYHAFQLLDWRREITNRVTSQVTPRAADPDEITTHVRSNSTSSGVTNHVDVNIPAAPERALTLVVIASAVQSSDREWHTPLGPTSGGFAPFVPTLPFERSDAVTLRAYHSYGGRSSSSTYRFYTDAGASGGAWIAHIWIIPPGEWYRGHTDVAGPHAEWIEGHDPPDISPQWTRTEPTIYVVAASGLRSASSPNLFAPKHPEGYVEGLESILSSPASKAAALMTSMKPDVTSVEDPRLVEGIFNFTHNHSAVFAIRGFNGDPKPKGDRVQVTSNDVDSQDEHNAVRTHPLAPDVFRTISEAEAYNDKVLGRYADDRPVIEVAFHATRNRAYRSQAARRRLGDPVLVTANDNAGMGIAQAFWIESIRHRWGRGANHWEVGWQLSPVDPVEPEE